MTNLERFFVAEADPTRVAFDTVARWTVGECPAILVISGPKGSGKTLCINEAIRGLGALPNTILFLDAKQDWTEQIARLSNEAAAYILVDDLDMFDNKFQKKLLLAVEREGVRLLATVGPNSDRLQRQLGGKSKNRVLLITLCDVHERHQDLVALVRHQFQSRFQSDIMSLIEASVCTLSFSRGLHDVLRFIEQLNRMGSEPTNMTVLTAYRRACGPEQDKAPRILVEGITDRLYLTWAAHCAGAELKDVLIEDCGGASKIPLRAVELRNSGMQCVGLFDYDEMGLKSRDALKGFGHSAQVLPQQSWPFTDIHLGHLKKVVEIEDILPIALLERFYQDHSQSRPELFIEAPLLKRSRIVVADTDKLAVAQWIIQNAQGSDAKPLLDVLNGLLAEINLPQIPWAPPNNL